MATVSPKTGVSSTKPSIVERNAGHSVLNTCFPLKSYVMVVSSLIVFHYYSWVSLSTSGWWSTCSFCQWENRIYFFPLY
jgi:hypothetical protein